MNFKFYCPSRFEVPRTYKDRTIVFGMGKKNAEKLGEELSASPDDRIPVVYGCAGSLRSDFRPGDVFAIGEISGKKMKTPNIIASALASALASAKLSSSPTILKVPSEKLAFRSQTGADLVDQEMDYIFTASSPEMREKLIFIRGVIDGLNDDISFISERGILWSQLIVPRNLLGCIKFFIQWKRYLKQIEQALDTLGPHP